MSTAVRQRQGEQARRWRPREPGLGEADGAPPALTDPYSASKSEAEMAVLAAARDGFAACVVNPVNIYRPSPRGPLSYNAPFLEAGRGQVQAVVDAPVGWVLAEDAATGQHDGCRRRDVARRSEVYGRFPPVRVDDRGGAGIGLRRPCGREFSRPMIVSAVGSAGW